MVNNELESMLKWLCFNLRYYSRICLDGFKKTMKDLSQVNQSLSQNL
jgi:hypothetical protein